MTFEWYTIPLLILAGFATGIINTVAGSGSLISLPFLIFIGLPPGVANGTNRIAILLQNVIGTASFRHQKVFSYKESLPFVVPAVIGSVIGAFLAVDLNEEIMRKTIGFLLAAMFFLILLKPKAWISGKAERINAKTGIVQYIIFFFIGMYGGFIQAGVGLFLLAGLVLGAGFDLVKANAIKVFVILFFTLFALVVFIYNDKVNYTAGIIMAAGNMLGAFVASKLAVKKGAGFIRYFLLVIIIFASLQMLGVFNLIFKV